eukprot:14167377-Alexandrium_andersonii.AAC.1
MPETLGVPTAAPSAPVPFPGGPTEGHPWAGPPLEAPLVLPSPEGAIRPTAPDPAPGGGHPDTAPTVADSPMAPSEADGAE